MSAIFAALFAINPVAPLLFLAVLVNGVAAPPIYFAWRKEPVSLSNLWVRAKARESGALYAAASWVALIVVGSLVVVVMLASKLLS